MDWWLILSLLLGGTIGLILVGLPVAFAFMLVNVIAAMFLWGGDIGLWAVFRTMRQSVSMFALVPVPLFVLMGEVLFQSGIASKVLEALDKWFGRLPGRLSLLAVGSGTLFATLSGASMASVALMGSVLVPEMVRHGYKKPISIGAVMGSGGLAMIIPPSGLAVLLAAIA